MNHITYYMLLKTSENRYFITSFENTDHQYVYLVRPSLVTILEKINFSVEIFLYNDRSFFSFPINVTYTNSKYEYPTIITRNKSIKYKNINDKDFFNINFWFRGPILCMPYLILITGVYASDFWFDYNMSKLYLGINNIPNVGGVFMCNNFNPNQLFENLFIGSKFSLYQFIIISIGFIKLFENDLGYNAGYKINIDFVPSLDRKFSNFLTRHINIYLTHVFIGINPLKIMLRYTLILNHFGYISFIKKIKSKNGVEHEKSVVDILINIELALNFIFDKDFEFLKYIKLFLFFKSIFNSFRLFFSINITILGFCLQFLINTKGMFTVLFYTELICLSYKIINEYRFNKEL